VQPRLLWLEQAFGLFEREAAKIVERVARGLKRPHETERQQFLSRPGRSSLGLRGFGGSCWVPTWSHATTVARAWAVSVR